VLRVASPLGTIEIAWLDGAITWLGIGAPGGPVPGDDPLEVGPALAAYFAGDLHALDHLPAQAEGTDFQKKVWAALRGIPPGETRTYAELSRQLGRGSRGARAVGAACAKNPIGLIVPCHRVLGRDGALTGYAWGQARKRWLLIHEDALRQQSLGL
jgi:methylated-DNA-[protein]-cysteine S-methyltransferase